MDRRGFLGSMMAVTLAPKEVAAVPRPIRPENYHIDFELKSPCDMHYHEDDVTSFGFLLEIHDTTNHKAYDGYIEWWALPSEEAKRDAAYLTGTALCIDGIARVVFP